MPDFGNAFGKNIVIVKESASLNLKESANLNANVNNNQNVNNNNEEYKSPGVIRSRPNLLE